MNFTDRYVTKAAFARAAGVSQPRVSELIKAERLTLHGKKIDSKGTETLDYLHNRHANTPGGDPNGGRERYAGELPDGVIAGSSVKAVTEQAKAKKLVAEAQLKELTIKERRGELVDRRAFGDNCLHYLEELNRRMLTDLPAGVSVAVSDLERDEHFPVKVEREIHDQVSKLLEDARGKILQMLDAAITAPDAEEYGSAAE